MILTDLHKRIQAIDLQYLVDEALESLKRNKERITKINKEQLFRGEQSDGELMPFYRAEPTTRIRLFDTGDFHRSFYLDLTKESIRVWATDYKTGMLVDRYSENIFGVTEDNLQVVINEIIEPHIYNKIISNINAVI